MADRPITLRLRHRRLARAGVFLQLAFLERNDNDRGNSSIRRRQRSGICAICLCFALIGISVTALAAAIW
jgi:hypothetical protein